MSHDGRQTTVVEAILCCGAKLRQEQQSPLCISFIFHSCGRSCIPLQTTRRGLLLVGWSVPLFSLVDWMDLMHVAEILGF